MVSAPRVAGGPMKSATGSAASGSALAGGGQDQPLLLSTRGALPPPLPFPLLGSLPFFPFPFPSSGFGTCSTTGTGKGVAPSADGIAGSEASEVDAALREGFGGVGGILLPKCVRACGGLARGTSSEGRGLTWGGTPSELARNGSDGVGAAVSVCMASRHGQSS